MFSWTNEKGEIVVDVAREIKRNYKAELIAILLGLYVPTKQEKVPKIVSSDVPAGLADWLLRVSGDPDTMPTLLRKQINELRQQTRIDLKSDLNNAIDTLSQFK